MSVAGTEHSGVTIWVVNGLDQDISLQMEGTYAYAAPQYVDLNTPLAVTAGTNGALTLLETEQGGWQPFIYGTITPAGLPSKGTLTIYLMRKVSDVFTLYSADLRSAATQKTSVTYW